MAVLKRIARGRVMLALAIALGACLCYAIFPSPAFAEATVAETADAQQGETGESPLPPCPPIPAASADGGEQRAGEDSPDGQQQAEFNLAVPIASTEAEAGPESSIAADQQAIADTQPDAPAQPAVPSQPTAPTQPAAETPDAPIQDGAYVIKALAAPYARALEVHDDSLAPGRVWADNVSGAYSQVWYFQQAQAGFYAIFSLHSGLALDLSGDELTQAGYTGSDGQLFSLRAIDRGYGLVTASDRAMTLIDQSIIPTGYDGRAEQRFRLMAAPLIIPGVYAFAPSADTDARVTVADNSTSADAALTAASPNASLAQKYVVSRTGRQSGALQSANSALYAAAAGDGVTQVAEHTSWDVSFSTSGQRRGLVFSQPDGRTMTYDGAGGKALSLSDIALTAQQAFLPSPVRLVEDGAYVITNAASGKALDIYDGRRSVYANLWTYAPNDTNAQKFTIAHVGEGLYSLRNVATGRPIGVRDANAEMLSWNGGADQLWRVEAAGLGALRFINALAGTALNIAGNSTADGANVNAERVSSTAAQQFKLTPTAYTIDKRIDLGVPAAMQNPELPTGCESVALTNALLYYGFNIAKTTIADSYMPWSGTDFVYAFMGNPHTNYGAAIMAPGITNTANSFLVGNGSPLRATNITGTNFNDLYQYLVRGTPVVVWSTMYMLNRGYAQASRDGYTLYSLTHAVTLAGYDEDAGTVLVSDPLEGSVWRDVGRFSYLYDAMGKQAVIIE